MKLDTIREEGAPSRGRLSPRCTKTSIGRSRRWLWQAVRPVVRLMTAGPAFIAAWSVATPAAAQVTPTNTWTATTSGSWSSQGNWTPVAVPTSAASTVLQFNASGTTAYSAANDIANPFQTNGILFNSTSTGAITLTGSQLEFLNNGATGPVINLLAGSTGAVNIANDLLLTNNLSIGGAGTGALALSGALSGTGTLSLRAPTTVTLSGNNSAYSAAVNITRGTLSLNYGTDNNSKISGTVTLGAATIGGTATLNVVGNSTAATSQTLSSLVLNPGAHSIGITAGGTQTANLAATSFSRSSGSTLSLTLGSANASFSANAGANGSVFGWATIGSDFVVQSGSNLAAYTGYTTNNTPSSWVGGDITNTAVYAAGATATGVTTINSLRFNFAGASTITIGTAATDSLVITTGGILQTAVTAANNQIIQGPGFLTTGGSSDLVLTNKASGAGILAVYSQIGTSTSAPASVTFGGGTVSIGNTTSGASTQNFSTGGFYVNAGTVNARNAAVLGSTALALDNSTVARANPLGFNGSTPSTVYLSNGATLSVQISTEASNGTDVAFTLANPVVVSSGSATLSVTRPGGSADNNRLVFGNLTLNGDTTLNLTGGANYDGTFAGSSSFTGGVSGSVIATGTGGSTFVVGSAASTHTLSGLLRIEGTTSSVDIQGTISKVGNSANITKSNGGDLILTSGATASTLDSIAINGGRLFYNGANALGATPITVASGAILVNSTTAANLTNSITVASGGGLGSRIAGATIPAAGLPADGLLILNNDDSATSTLTLSGNYPALTTGGLTLQFGGTRNVTATNAIGATTLSGNLDVSGYAGAYTLTANYAAGTPSTATPATSSLFTVGGNTVLGTNNLVVAGTGAITLNAITTTGPGTNSISKTGTGFLVFNAANTFSGGVNAAGGVRVAVDSVLTSGVLTSGPVGTGTLTLAAGGSLQDNGSPRTLHNQVDITGNATFGSSGNSFLTLEDAGLTTATTVRINAASNPTLTVSNSTTTFSRAVVFAGGATGFTKAGPGTLTIDGKLADSSLITINAGTLLLMPGANTEASFVVNNGGTIRVEQSSLAFNNADNKVTLNSGAIAIRGTGVNEAEFQSWLGSAATDVVVAIAADSIDSYDFTGLSGRRLGSVSPGYAFYGSLTPDGSTYKLGGGGGILTYASQLTGARTVDVALGGTSAGDVYLTNAANNFTGGVNLTGAVRLATRGAAPIGTGPITYSAAGASILTTAASTTFSNAVALGTVGGTIDNYGNAVTLNGPVTGTGTLTLAGKGVTTLGSSIASGVPVTVNAPVVIPAATATPLGDSNLSLRHDLTLPSGSNSTFAAGAGGTTPTVFTFTGSNVSWGGTITVGNATSTVTNFQRAGTGSVLVLTPAGGTAGLGTTDRFIVNNSTASSATVNPTTFNSNGIVPAYVLGRDAGTGRGTFLNYDATNGYQAVAGTAVAAAASGITSSATTVYDVQGAQTAQAAASVFGLRTNSSITLAGTLTIAGSASHKSGLILNDAPTITGSTLAFSQEGVIYVGTGTATISSIVTGSNITITGPGRVNFTTATNTDTSRVVDGGTIGVGSDGNFGGASTTTLRNGGTFVFTASYDVNGGRRILADVTGGVVNFSTGNATLNDANQFETNGPLTIIGSGTGTISNNMIWNGPVYIAGTGTGGIVQTAGTISGGTDLANAINLVSGVYNLQTTNAKVWVLNGGSLAPSANTGTATNNVYSVGGGTLGGAGTLNLNGSTFLGGGTVTIGAGGTVNVNGPVVVDSGTVTFGGAGTVNINGLITLAGGTTNFGGAGTVNVNGTISGAVNPALGITKVGAGTTVLAGTNSYGGGTTIQAGTLTANSDAALGPSTSGLTFNTGAGTFKWGSAFNLGAGRTVNLASAATFDPGTFNVVVNGPITTSGAPAVTKIGSGTLEFANTISGGGALTISAGTLNLSATTGSNSFTTLATSPGTSLIAGTNTTFSGAASLTAATAGTYGVTVGAGKTITVNGNFAVGSSAGSITQTLNVTGGTGSAFEVVNSAASGSFAVGGSVANQTTADFGQISSLTVNLSGAGSVIRISPVSGTNTNGSYSTLILPSTGAGNSTLIASSLNIGDGGSNNGNPAASQVNSIRLGTGKTTINADTINVGSPATGTTRDLGHFLFNSTTAGTVEVRAKNGTGRADLNLGAGTATTATVSTIGNKFDVSGHFADLLLNNVAVGTQNRGIDYVSTLSFDNGKLDLVSLTAGTRTAGTVKTTAIIEIGGGDVTFGDVTHIIGRNTAAGGTGEATLNISGGTVNIGSAGTTPVSLQLATTTTAGGTSNGTLNVSGGSVTVTGDIIDTNGPGSDTSTVNLTGGTLNMSGRGLLGLNVLTFTGGTLRNLGSVDIPLAQTSTTGASLLDVLNSNTSITGAYTITGSATGSASAVVAPTRTLSATGAITLAGVAAGPANLVVNGSITGATSVTANASGVVAGSGSIAAPLSITGGTVAPGAIAGNDAATLTVSNSVTFGNAGVYRVDIRGTPSPTSDLLNITGAGGNLNLASAANTDALELLSTTNGTYTIISYTGSRTGFFDLVSLNGASQTLDSGTAVTDPAGFTAGTGTLFTSQDVQIFYNDTAGQVQVGVVPEPGSVAGIALAGAAGLLTRRRRRHA